MVMMKFQLVFYSLISFLFRPLRTIQNFIDNAVFISFPPFSYSQIPPPTHTPAVSSPVPLKFSLPYSIIVIHTYVYIDPAC